MKRLGEFLQEDNGRFSSIRLVLVWTVCVLVTGFIPLCIYFPELREIAIPFFTFAGGVAGTKAVQKFREENTNDSPPQPEDLPP